MRDSRPWKNELLRVAKRMRALRAAVQPLTEAKYIRLEKDFLFSAYSIRKLIEARKVCDKPPLLEVPVCAYRATSHSPTWFNRHDVETSFDLSMGSSTWLPLRHVCNQLIHSYVFSLEHAADDQPEGVYFSSDKQKDKSVYLLKLEDWAIALEFVGRDYPDDAKWTRSADGSSEVIVLKCYGHS